jgi:uncharacterized protein (TIGR02145 family)
MDLKNHSYIDKNRVIFCLVLLVGIIFVMQISCKKELPAEIPSLVTINITDITSASFSSGGLVFSSGSDPVLSRGICLSNNENPMVSDTRTIDGTGKGSFASTITGLMAGTTYYIRAYATNSVGTGYGNQYVITTSASILSITTSTVSSITSVTSISGGNITSDCNADVTERGVCWSTTPSPTIAGSKTSDGSGTGTFTSNLTNLNPGTTYFVRAYATSPSGTVYGNELTFVTAAIRLATLTTTPVTSVTLTNAESGGNISDSGGGDITARGVCWATTTAPTIDGSKTSDGTDSGVFTSSLTDLSSGTTYYVRAYATNSAGTSYGNEVTFETECNLPAAPGSISGSTNTVPNAMGVAYSISEVTGATNYTWTVPEGTTLISGQGTTGIIVDFGPTGGDVSVRSENSCGNSIFTTLNIKIIVISNCGTITDVEGNVYNTVTIGTQCWMSENLKTTRYNNGDPILTETDDIVWSTLTTGAYCWYNNDAASYQTLYGALYNWYSVDDSRDLCPTGWHVPTNSEWTSLEDFLETNGYNYDGSTFGNKFAITLATATGWNPSTVEGAVGNNDYSETRNSTGFTALPGGVRDANQLFFGSIGNYGMWWTSTEYNSSEAWDRGIATGYSSLGRLNVLKTHGFSVRCLKN